LRFTSPITFAGETFALAEGATMRTEFSSKYAFADLHARTTAAASRVREVWSNDALQAAPCFLRRQASPVHDGARRPHRVFRGAPKNGPAEFRDGGQRVSQGRHTEA
jgi:hypothetical protein